MYTILLISDNKQFRTIAPKFITHFNKDCVTNVFTDIQSGIRSILEDGAPDVIILDNGKDYLALNDIDVLDRHGILIPVIMVSDNTKTEFLTGVMDRHIEGLVLKGKRDPMAIFEELVSKITIAVERSRKENERRIDEKRMKALINISKMGGQSFPKIVEYALETAIELTGSEAGYVATYDKPSHILRIISWSKTALESCKVRTIPLEFDLFKTGVWGEPILQNKTIIINDYENDNKAMKKGLPPGHMPLHRLLMVPLHIDGNLKGTAGVCNKKEEYTWFDEVQVSHLMNDLISIYEHFQLTRNLAFETNVAMELLDAGIFGSMFVTNDMNIVNMNKIATDIVQCRKPSLRDPIPLDSIDNAISVQIHKMINSAQMDNNVHRESLSNPGMTPYDVFISPRTDGFVVVFINMEEIVIRDNAINRAMEHIRIIEGPVQKSMDKINRHIQTIDASNLSEIQAQSIMKMNDAITFIKDYRDVGIERHVWIDVTDAFNKAIGSSGANGVEFNVKTDRVKILADPKFISIFTNLLSNSINHGKNVTRIDLDYRISGGVLTLIYSDDGVGISNDMRGKLHQLVNEGKYGMFLIYNIISASELKISNPQTPNGTVFEIEIPPNRYSLE